MVRRARQQAERRGRWAETYAASWLRLKGYTILAHRVKTRFGEIDLIARRGRVLAFIEVKQRRARSLAENAVPDSAWLRIAQAAEIWSARQKRVRDLDWRYDYVAITPWALPRHYRDYWRP